MCSLSCTLLSALSLSLPLTSPLSLLGPCPLQNRIGAIKLKNGSVSAARDAPKGCKFGLIVHAPDPVNKRQ